MKICLSCEGVTDTQAQRCGHCGAYLLSTETVHYPSRRGEVDAGNPLLGTVIDGKYRLLSVLGRGGLGTVFRAQHIGSLVTVALKLLHPRFSERPEYRRALLPEARRAATVVHERCARLLDVGEGDEGISYLAMELVEGQTLDEVLQTGALLPSHAVDILLQVAEALTAVHEVGLVHCDLSPRNVMVSARSGRLEVKVLDFGIARSMTLAGREHARGELIGFANPAFSPPELLAGADVDARADLYSLGTLAWLMLTGHMPVEVSDNRLAAAAVRAGRLLPWPGAPGAPKRLVQVVRECVRTDPAERPSSAREVHDRLAAVRLGRGPLLARLAAFVSASALVVTLLAGSENQPVFLRPWPGSALELVDGPLTPDGPVVDLQPLQLETLGCYFGGFAPDRLRAEVARGGKVLFGLDLEPQIDTVAGTLLLSTAQPAWRDIVAGLVTSSREGPVGLTFVVPGKALLGSARVRLDDTPPTLEAHLEPQADVLRAASRLVVAVDDDVAVQSLTARLQLDAGPSQQLELPIVSGAFAIGTVLEQRTGSVAELGGGDLTLVAKDRAGNVRTLASMRVTSTDVAAPQVLEVTGPAGEPFLTRVDDRLRCRVRLSAGEPACELHCEVAGAPSPLVLPLLAGGSSEPVWLPIELPAALVARGDDLSARLVVVDRAGNSSGRDFVMAVRDRSLLLTIVPEQAPESSPISWNGHELIAGPEGGALQVTVGSSFGVVGARLAGQSPLTAGDAVRCQAIGKRSAQLHLSALLPGVYTVLLQLTETDSDPVAPVERRLPLRVLPERIELRLPTATARYLPGLLQAGVFLQRGEALAEGPGWRLEPSLRPYVGGAAWLGAEQPVSLAIPFGGSGPLLPDFVPVPGRNVMAVELHDVLERPVRLVDGDGRQVALDGDGRHVVADFWWHEAGPELIGEELLVEYGQPLLFRLRFPLPFARGDLKLFVAQFEVPPKQVDAAESGRCVALFEMPFAVWSVVAQLTDRPRTDYVERIERRVDASVITPAGRYPVALPLRTTRSTLSPMTLGELAQMPPALAGIRLLPVLAPATVFREPVPADCSPRAMFRPQQAVDVRNFSDFMLQDRELTWGEARALAAVAAGLDDTASRARCVHHDDPLAALRLQPEHLLPAASERPRDDSALCGVDFYQAWTLCRLLGVAVAGNPELFRLPLGCELELAGFAGADRPACYAAAANGGAVRMADFLTYGRLAGRGSAATTTELMRAGDLVDTAFELPFVGLDFGVREWVLDLPHQPGSEQLLREWVGDHSVHLRLVLAMADGTFDTASGGGSLHALGVVRGLALGEIDGLIDDQGARLELGRHDTLPASVPGVLRSEQLRRDGRDLLGRGRDPRLAHIGFRIAGRARDLARLWGYR